MSILKTQQIYDQFASWEKPILTYPLSNFEDVWRNQLTQLNETNWPFTVTEK